MDVAAKVTSKGQVTVPKAVREALGIKEGDEVVFRVEGDRAVLGPYARLPRPAARSRAGGEAQRGVGRGDPRRGPSPPRLAGDAFVDADLLCVI